MTLEEGIKRAEDRGDWQMVRWLSDLRFFVGAGDMTVPIPCQYYVTSNTPARQMKHVASEVAEAWEALVNGNIDSCAEELTDVITACTTMLEMLDYTKDRRAVLQARVNEKNRRRGYWVND